MASKKPRGRGVDATGRSKRAGGFVMFDHGLMDSAAWLSSSPAMRAYVLQVARRYMGKNNGDLPFGIQDAVNECRIARNTAVRASAEAVERGFLECAEAGGFNRKDKRTTRWRLTWRRCDVTGALPTRAFRDWKPTVAKCAPVEAGAENISRSQNEYCTVANGVLDRPEMSATVANGAPERAESDLSTVSKCALVSRYIPRPPTTFAERLAAALADPTQSPPEDYSDVL